MDEISEKYQVPKPFSLMRAVKEARQDCALLLVTLRFLSLLLQTVGYIGALLLTQSLFVQ